MKCMHHGLFLLLVCLAAALSAAQTGYQVISVQDGGTITGTIKWEGPEPHLTPALINKDPEVCDPQGQKHRDLERLLISPNHGVANTVVYLKDITRGKAMDLPEPRRFLNQQTCRYEPHILLVPLQGDIKIKSSDPLLHTVHMSGAADYNLPFPFKDQVVNRTMNREGVVDLHCNAGHIWMNAEMIVAPNPYYAVTNADGQFELTQVPAGEYEIVAWHEGWRVVGESTLYDVMTQVRVKRPVFSAPVVWSKHVTVSAGQAAEVNFELGEKTPQMAMGR